MTITLSGRVIKRRFAAGSKSDRLTVFLQTDKDEFVLRRKGGVAYGDQSLEALVGKHVQCTGTLVGYTLLMTNCEEIKSP